jgi:hypothetical protein
LLLWRVLDESDQGYVTLKEFYRAADVLNINLQMASSRRNIWSKNLPAVYNSAISKQIRIFVESAWCNYIFNVIIICNVLIIAIDKTESSLTINAECVQKNTICECVEAPRYAIARARVLLWLPP